MPVKKSLTRVWAPKPSGDADDPGPGQKGADLHAEFAQGHQDRHDDDGGLSHAPQQRRERGQLGAAARFRGMVGETLHAPADRQADQFEHRHRHDQQEAEADHAGQHPRAERRRCPGQQVKAPDVGHDQDGGQAGQRLDDPAG
ncbi:hypothetical protein [Caulobacter sp. 602-1]|uniref:hypothetical protein n=1 Tax=Caulobacter sp. 602-1 TaxID=2492472 RepID=UPI00131581F8|nr:hypothetical protein [Caulobacter sp. 602-1]